MVVDWPPVVRSVVAVVPAMGALTLALGPYDGFFDDREIFLLLLAGLGVGLLVAFLELSLLFTSGGIHPAFYLLGAPLAAQLAKAVVLNLPRFQDDPGGVFRGASLGAGLGAMVVLGYGNTTFFLDPANLASTGLRLAALGTGIGAFHVATGALVGDHVARGHPFLGLLRATVAQVPLAFASLAIVALRAFPGDQDLWAVVGLVYGVAVLLYARRRVMDRGLTDDQRRQRRRQLRDAS